LRAVRRRVLYRGRCQPIPRSHHVQIETVPHLLLPYCGDDCARIRRRGLHDPGARTQLPHDGPRCSFKLAAAKGSKRSHGPSGERHPRSHRCDPTSTTTTGAVKYFGVFVNKGSAHEIRIRLASESMGRGGISAPTQQQRLQRARTTRSRTQSLAAGSTSRPAAAAKRLFAEAPARVHDRCLLLARAGLPGHHASRTMMMARPPQQHLRARASTSSRLPRRYLVRQ
jgi:hypothetical protein